MDKRPLNVLIVDDDVLNREMLAGFLEGIGKCEFAGNGNEALAAVETAFTSGKNFDLILLDYKMPELDGMEFIQRLRADEAMSGVIFGKGIPIIMITAYKEVFMKAFRLGVKNYLLKPVSCKDLLEKIQAL